MPKITIITPSTTTGSGYTLATYYRRLASELGFYQATIASSLATLGDTTRYIIADELRDDEADYDFFGRPWVYISTGALAATQRRILSHPAGYLGPLGALTVSRPYDQVVPVGSVLEVTNPLPVKRHLSIKGLADCVNEALALINIKTIATVTGNGGYEYDLAALSYLTDERQIIGIYDTAYLDPTYPAQESPWSFEVRANGVDRTLVTSRIYSTAETFDLHFIIKANRLVFDGTTWSYLSNNVALGLQGDLYQAAAPPQWVHTFAMVKALQHLRLMTSHRTDVEAQALQRAMAEIERRVAFWASAAARIKVKEFPRPHPPRLVGMVYADQSAPGWY